MHSYAVAKRFDHGLFAALSAAAKRTMQEFNAHQLAVVLWSVVYYLRYGGM